VPTTLYQMRALRKISHDNILRVPGDTNTQDFWVDSTTRDLLVNLGFAQIINAGAAQPVLSTPLSSLTLLSQAGVPQKVVGSDGQDVALPGASSAVVGAFTTRALAASDNGATLICSSAQTATVGAGLGAGFGCAFKGAVSFTGSGATVNDVRTTGAANPWCSLVQTGTDTYDIVGGKA